MYDDRVRFQAQTANAGFGGKWCSSSVHHLCGNLYIFPTNLTQLYTWNATMTFTTWLQSTRLRKDYNDIRTDDEKNHNNSNWESWHIHHTPPHHWQQSDVLSPVLMLCYLLPIINVNHSVVLFRDNWQSFYWLIDFMRWSSFQRYIEPLLSPFLISGQILK